MTIGRGWLTPDNIPGATFCRAIYIPNSIEWLAIVTGALIEMTFPYNWEKYGLLTPEDCAARSFQMVDEFTFLRLGCRVIGEIVPFAGASSPYPNLWLPCNGQSVLRSDYPDLFATIGTAYGAADLAHFNLPDLRGVTLIGQGGGYSLAVQVGEATHTLTTAEIPSHSHADTGHAHTEGTALPAVGAAITGVPVPSAVPGVGVTGIASANIANTGGGLDHNNIQPSMPITYLIVAKDR